MTRGWFYSTHIYHFIDKDGDEGFGLYVDDGGETKFQLLYPPVYEDDEPDIDSNEEESEAEESE